MYVCMPRTSYRYKNVYYISTDITYSAVYEILCQAMKDLYEKNKRNIQMNFCALFVIAGIRTVEMSPELSDSKPITKIFFYN